MPFDCDSFRFFQGFDDVETVPKEVVDPLSSEWNVSLGHLKVSYQRVEQLVALNQQWLILNHTIYLVKPMSVGEWRVILAEYIHRQRD